MEQQSSSEKNYLNPVGVNEKVLSGEVKHADIINGGEIFFVMMGRLGR